MQRHLYRLSLAVLLVSASGQAFAQANQPFTASQAYKDCTALTNSDPAAALAKAQEWLKIDDTVAPHHCRAMALYGQKNYADSGAELDLVRTKIDPSDVTLRSYVAQQGARAWVEAGNPENAIRVLTEQINELTTVKGDNVTQSKLATDMLLDRSKIRITYGQLPEAVQDLDQAISLAPGNEKVLLQRAKVFAQLGDVGLAQQDLQVVLKMNPKQAEAIGLMRVLRDVKADAKTAN